MDHKKYEHDLKRINKTLRRGAIERNIKTGLIVAAAASGALINTPALIITAGITMGALYFANNRQEIKTKNSETSNLDLPGSPDTNKNR